MSRQKGLAEIDRLLSLGCPRVIRQGRDQAKYCQRSVPSLRFFLVSDRSRMQPWIPLALAAKAGFDAFQAAKLTYDQYAKHRAACMWCLIAAAAATLARAALVVPEAKAALREVQKRC
jgi:hypothetical protein